MDKVEGARLAVPEEFRAMCEEEMRCEINFHCFTRDVARLINQHSIDSACGTSDRVLADFVAECLRSLRKASMERRAAEGRRRSAEGA